MPHRGEQFGVVLALVGTLILGTPSTDVGAAPPASVAASSLPHQGDRSLAVAQVQQLLLQAGVHVAGGVDGVYGPSTTKAVRQFQQARGLVATGAVDDATATALGMLAPTAVLAPGASGDAVRAVQQQLVAAGIRVAGGVDGVYGPATAKAVSAYQAARNLPTTGQVDALTAALLAAKPAAAAPAAAPTLDVLAVQRQLIVVGARPKGGADGVLGPATRAAITTFQRWNGLPATGDPDAATLTALATAAKAATAPTLDAFPLPRSCSFWDTWGAPRSGGRVHQGVDIFAPKGTPVFAVEPGRISRQKADFPGSLGGNQLWLTASDGSRYFYGHLSGFAKGVGVGSPVRAGDVIGYAGATGLTTVSHLHFEIHPGGGAAVNPYPVLKALAGC
ncbi:MAG: peptidoglycan-binding protein [Actinobacteria bacterium]|nr:peptidoglycan-binding protein [Actinomycetota bacterium]